MQWDPYGDNLKKSGCEVLDGLNALIVAIGAHHATHLDIEALFLDLDMIYKLQDCGKQTRLVFITSPPTVPRTDEWPESYKDRRSGARMREFGALSKSMIERKYSKWFVVHQLELLTPFLFDPLFGDLAHYVATDGLDAVLDEVTAKAGICQ